MKSLVESINESIITPDFDLRDELNKISKTPITKTANCYYMDLGIHMSIMDDFVKFVKEVKDKFRLLEKILSKNKWSIKYQQYSKNHIVYVNILDEYRNTIAYIDCSLVLDGGGYSDKCIIVRFDRRYLE